MIDITTLDEATQEGLHPLAMFLIAKDGTLYITKDEEFSPTPVQADSFVIAKIGDRLSAIIVTWDKDFRKLANRIPEENREKFRHLGGISYRCNEVRGLALSERWIEATEFHYSLALRRPDIRMIVQNSRRWV